MLSQAQAGDRVRYALAAAEALPVRSGSVHLLTCGAAFHWFRRDTFLGELRRVLFPDGAAVIYDGARLFTVRDETLHDAGKVGVWSKADSVTQFDSLQHGDKS